MVSPHNSMATARNEDEEDNYIRDERRNNMLSGRPAEGVASAPLEPQKFQHSFWDPQVAHLRKIYFKIIGPAVMLTIIVMWLCLPVYWGSLGEQSQHLPNLKLWFINRDPNGALGQGMLQALQANNAGQGVPTNGHFTWLFPDATEFASDEDVKKGVLDEKVYAAVVVEQDATANANLARSNGDASYNASLAITFYYNQGRNENAANNIIVPLTQALLAKSTAKISAQFTAQWLSASAANPTAITNAAKAPQTVASPFGYTAINLRPFTKSVSTAVLLVGQIYVTIFAFVVVMANDAARGTISPFLRFRSYAVVRLVVPMVAYIPLSLSYALIQLPFHVTFGQKYSFGGGFMMFWVFVYLGMAAQGLAIEAMITILTPRFVSNFLLFLIIFNVSVASVPIVLQPGFYRYGYGFPVYNLSQAIRTIVFDTKNHLGLNAGVLMAWIVLSCLTIPLFTWITRRKEVTAFEQGESAEKVENAQPSPASPAREGEKKGM